MDECMGHKEASEKVDCLPSCFFSPHSIRCSDVSSYIHWPPSPPCTREHRNQQFLAKVVCFSVQSPSLWEHRPRSQTDPAQMMNLPCACCVTSQSCSERKIHTISQQGGDTKWDPVCKCPQSLGASEIQAAPFPGWIPSSSTQLCGSTQCLSLASDFRCFFLQGRFIFPAPPPGKFLNSLSSTVERIRTSAPNFSQNINERVQWLLKGIEQLETWVS